MSYQSDFSYAADRRIQEFYEWQEQARQPGHRIKEGKFESALFIPNSKVKSYLTANRVRDLLEACSVLQFNNVIGIQSYRSVVFCILLSCEKGQHITTCARRESIVDTHLPIPLATLLQEFPSNEYGGLAREFDAAQWEWCARELRNSEMDDMNLESQCILPITEWVQVGRGGTAQVYRIKLHHDYNILSVWVSLRVLTSHWSIDGSMTDFHNPRRPGMNTVRSSSSDRVVHTNTK
jgi:hypothetical protein